MNSSPCNIAIYLEWDVYREIFITQINKLPYIFYPHRWPEASCKVQISGQFAKTVAASGGTFRGGGGGGYCN